MVSGRPALAAASGIFFAEADVNELVSMVVYTEEAIDPPVQRPVALFTN